MKVYQLEKSEEKGTVLAGVESPKKAEAQQRGQIQHGELPRVLNLENESSEHFK